MKLNRLLLLGLLFATGIVNAQTDFRPGYIIKADRDTIYGQIDYRGDFLMSSVCRFKNQNGEITPYHPNNITAFRFIDSKFYVSRDVNHRKVFLEYLIKGKVNIYYMRDNIGDHYYLDKEGEVLTEIPFKEGIKYIDDKKIFYQSNNHIGILKYYMQDATGFQSRIKSIKKPEHQNLIKLAEDYHHAVCNDEECIIYEKKIRTIKISITPFTGLTKYNGYDKLVTEYGGYLYIWAPRTSEKLFFKTGLAFNRISEEGVNLDIYKIPIQLQYIYQAHKIQPKISAGINIKTLKGYKDINHTLAISTGLDYLISKNISLSAEFNSDFTSLSKVILNENSEFDLMSYSIIIGLRIDI